jgi:hypothetical protein
MRHGGRDALLLLASRLADENPQNRTALILFACILDDPAKQADLYTRAIAIAPSRWAYVSLAGVLKVTKRYSEAVAAAAAAEAIARLEKFVATAPAGTPNVEVAKSLSAQPWCEVPGNESHPACKCGCGTCSTAQEVTALMGLWQSGAISYDTLYYNLQRGEWARPSVTVEQEREAIAVIADAGATITTWTRYFPDTVTPVFMRPNNFPFAIPATPPIWLPASLLIMNSGPARLPDVLTYWP